MRLPFGGRGQHRTKVETGGLGLAVHGYLLPGKDADPKPWSGGPLGMECRLRAARSWNTPRAAEHAEVRQSKACVGSNGEDTPSSARGGHGVSPASGTCAGLHGQIATITLGRAVNDCERRGEIVQEAREKGYFGRVTTSDTRYSDDGQ